VEDQKTMQLTQLNDMSDLSGNLVLEMHFLLRTKRSTEFLRMEAFNRKLAACNDRNSRCECKKCIGPVQSV